MVSKLLLADTNLLTTPRIKPFIASRASVVSLSKKKLLSTGWFQEQIQALF